MPSCSRFGATDASRVAAASSRKARLQSDCKRFCASCATDVRLFAMSRTALIVEDDDAIRDSLADLLRDEGWRVELAPDGQQALLQLRRGLRPDVILLDLMLPIMNGWEFRVEQRRDPPLALLPVVAMSADSSSK